MSKIDTVFTKNAYNNFVDEYYEAVTKVGLWQSELAVIKQYFDNLDGKLLDMGCGVGRTTFNLYELGYHNLYPVDLSNKMIEKANLMQQQIKFEVGNCTDLSYDDCSFDYALFSFNGLMQIPQATNRKLALNELYRVLKPNGILIFTTHDRSFGTNAYLDAWREERYAWLQDKQDSRLHELGDVLITNNNQEYFIHIPTYNEVLELIEQSGFSIIETFIRSECFDESSAVRDFSDDCRFWIVKKN